MDEQPDTSAHALNARVLRFRSQDSGEPPESLARDLMAAGRHGDARGVLILAQDRSEDSAPNPTLSLLEGEAWMADGDDSRAVACFMRAARLSPRDPAGFRALADALLERRDLVRADKAIERCLLLDAEDARGLELRDRLQALRDAAETDAAAAMPEIDVELDDEAVCDDGAEMQTPNQPDGPDEVAAAQPIEDAAAQPIEDAAAQPIEDAAARPIEDVTDEPYTAPVPPSPSTAPAVRSSIADTSPGLGLAPSDAPPAPIGMPPIPSGQPVAAPVAKMPPIPQTAARHLVDEDAVTTHGDVVAPAAELSPSTAGMLDAMTPLSGGTLTSDSPSSAGQLEAVSPSSAGTVASPAAMQSSPGTLSAMGTLTAPSSLTSAGGESSPGTLSSPGTMASVDQLGAATAAAAVWTEPDLPPVADGSDDETSGVNALPQEPADATDEGDAQASIVRGPVDLDDEAIGEIAESMEKAFEAYERDSRPADAPEAAAADELDDAQSSVGQMVEEALQDAPLPSQGEGAVWVPTPMDVLAASEEPVVGLRLDPEISGDEVITTAPASSSASPWITLATMAVLAIAGYFGHQQWRLHGAEWSVEGQRLWSQALTATGLAAPAPEPTAAPDADTAPTPTPTPTPAPPVVAEPAVAVVEQAPAEPAAAEPTPEVEEPAAAEPAAIEAPAADTSVAVTPPADRAAARARLPELRKAADADGADATTLARYAAALYQGDYVDKAAGVYDRALAIDPTHVQALLGRAEVDLRAERPAEAIALLKKARGLADDRLSAPIRARLLGLLGRAHLQRAQPGDRRAARQALRKAVDLEGVSAESFFWLGEAMAGRQTSHAAEAYQRYLQLAPRGKYAVRAKRALGPLL